MIISLTICSHAIDFKVQVQVQLCFINNLYMYKPSYILNFWIKVFGSTSNEFIKVVTSTCKKK